VPAIAQASADLQLSVTDTFTLAPTDAMKVGDYLEVEITLDEMTGRDRWVGLALAELQW
jgi:hypothetical protein